MGGAKNSRKLLLDEKGFTLVEISIAGGILMLGVLGIMHAASTNTKLQNSAKSFSDIDAMNTLAITALGEQESCSATFAGIALPAAGATVSVPAIVRKPAGSAASSVVLKKWAAGDPLAPVIVSDIRLGNKGNVTIEYKRTADNAMGGQIISREIMAPVTWNGTNIVCTGTASTNIEATFKQTCEANGGYYDASKPQLEDRCMRCADNEYNAAAPGSPIECHLIAEKACSALGTSVAFWDAGAQQCRTCSKAGQILKKKPGAWNETQDCVNSIDAPSFTVALNCAAPNKAAFYRTPDGTLMGKCETGSSCTDSRTDDAVKAEFCAGTEARDNCGTLRGVGIKNDPVACNEKLIFAMHSVKDCLDAGGTIEKGPLGEAEKFCRFSDVINKNPACKFATGYVGGVDELVERLVSASSSDCTASYMTYNPRGCPSGWTQYKKYSKWAAKARYGDAHMVEYGVTSCIPDLASKKKCRAGYFSEPNAYCSFQERTTNFADIAEPPCAVTQRKWVMESDAIGYDYVTNQPIMGPPKCKAQDSTNSGSGGCNVGAYGGWKIEDFGCY